MKVIIFEINKGTKSHFYRLKTVDGDVIYNCPTYRTIAGVCKWAFKNGFIPVNIED